MRYLLLIMLGLVYFLGGCAIPRTAYMAARVREEVPVVPTGSMRVVKVEGSAVPGYKTPGGQITIHSPMTAVETYDWYRAELLRRGWTLKSSYSNSPSKNFPEWEAPVADERGEFYNTYNAERKTSWIYESIMFHLSTYDAPEGGCNLQLFFDGWYAWDIPTWVFNGAIVSPFVLLLHPVSSRQAPSS